MDDKNTFNDFKFCYLGFWINFDVTGSYNLNLTISFYNMDKTFWFYNSFSNSYCLSKITFKDVEGCKILALNILVPP